MGIEFRRRDYRAEEEKSPHSLLRTNADDSHPLSNPPRSPLQVEESDSAKNDFFDPLRSTDGTNEAGVNDTPHEDIPFEAGSISGQLTTNEWIYFKKKLMQRFPVSRIKVEKPSRDSYSADGPGKFDEQDVKVTSQQECLLELQELKDKIYKSWCADDRVTSLRLSIKVARLLMDTSVIQFYPTLFVLATDILDMLGDLVWNRIKQRAEITEGGVICSLPDNFRVSDVCLHAKETCNNWFNKIGAIRELLPRIYLELAILPCCRFLHDHPQDILRRLVLMTRGIADPLASAYCRLYLVQCAGRLSQHDKGFLITCINDLQLLLKCFKPATKALNGDLSGNSKLLLTLIEPTIEYVMRCLFKDLKQMEISNMFVSLGLGRNPTILSENSSCVSIILHYVLKELPIEFACSNAMELLHLIESTDDSSFKQSLNFRLLGHRLCERVPDISRVHLVVDKIIQVLSSYYNLEAHVTVADAYLEIILENQLGSFLNVILDGIFERVQEEKLMENEIVILQSIFSKILTHVANIKDILALNHFVEILDMIRGSSRMSINMQILSMSTRDGQIRDPTIIEVLLEVAQALYDGLDFSNLRKDDYQQLTRLISRFVYMVDYGAEVESHLRFLAQCRGAFASISELQEMLVHCSNNLAVRAMRDGNSSVSFVKSCLAFNEITIPAIPTNSRHLNLYLETAEVALLGGYISHSDGLIKAAVNCLQNVDSGNGTWMDNDVDGIISLMCKLCGILVMVPGNLEQGVTWIPKNVLSFLESQSWILPRMKTKVLSAFIFLLAALSQNQSPYHAVSAKVISNYQLFLGVQPYHQELLSLSGVVLQVMVDILMQESSMAVRGKIALEVCNCVASALTASDETVEMCAKLVGIAKSCLSAGDKFLQSTLKFLDARQFLV